VITAKAESDHEGLSAAFRGAALAQFGSAIATRLPALADRAPYNKARGFSLSDQHLLADIVGFYDDVGVRPAVEVSEPDVSERLGGLLSDARFSPIAHGVTLHMAPRRVPPHDVSGLEIHEVGQGHCEGYVTVLLDAYELPVQASTLRRVLAHEHASPGLRRYLAVIDGVPAAAAALYTCEGTGLFAGAATLPAFRRRGCQSALIAQRLADATADSDLVVATAAVGSASHDNLARHGFETTHHRTLWQRYGRTP
jgi:GNAT superfamily N-acetyltransferase